MRTDECRVDRRQGGVGQPEPVGQVAPQIVDHPVRGGDETMKHFLSGRSI